MVKDTKQTLRIPTKTSLCSNNNGGFHGLEAIEGLMSTEGPDGDVIRPIDFCFFTLSKRLTNINRQKD
jgi:hypothetical protein